jgi:hypothetical protein
MGKLFILPLFFYYIRLVRTGKGGKEGRQKKVKTTLQELASPKCCSRTFIILKFLEAEGVMNKNLN